MSITRVLHKLSRIELLYSAGLKLQSATSYYFRMRYHSYLYRDHVRLG